MKRVICLAVAAIFIFCAITCCVSCGEADTPPQTEPQTDTSATVADQTGKETERQSETAEQASLSETETETEASGTEETTGIDDTEASVSSASDTSASETSGGNPYEYAKAADYTDLDFGGKTFRIIYRWEPVEEKPSGWGYYFDLYEDADNPDDILTAAVAFRRNTMKLYYNCNVVGVPSLNASGEAATAINSGSREYDLVLAQYMLTGYGTSKMYYNLLPMINRNYDCWDEAILRDYSFANKLYGITGDLSISDDECMLVMLFNKDILNEHNMEYPYELVRKGEWTLEKLYQMSRECASNVNGDSEFDLNGDIFGTVMWADCWEFLFIGCGGRFISPVKEDGTVDWVGNALGYESDIYTLCLQYLNDPTTGGIKPAIGVPDGGTEVVGSGHAAFFLSQLGNITSTKQLAFRDYENFNYGIIPVPKWNTDQTKYYSTFSVNIGLYAAPITCDYKTTSDFLNVYALASQATVQKAYEYAVTYAYASDANVQEMLDIANAGRVWDYSLYTETTLNAQLTSDCRANKNRWASRMTSGEKKVMTSAKLITDLYADNPHRQIQKNMTARLCGHIFMR